MESPARVFLLAPYNLVASWLLSILNLNFKPQNQGWKNIFAIGNITDRKVLLHFLFNFIPPPFQHTFCFSLLKLFGPNNLNVQLIIFNTIVVDI